MTKASYDADNQPVPRKSLLNRDISRPALVVVIPLVVYLFVLQGNREQDRVGRARNSASQSNLKQIGLALTAYGQNNGGAFPPMTPGRVDEALRPYVKNSEIWKRPLQGEKGSYLPNSSLSGKKLSSLAPGTVVFYEAGPYFRNGRSVLRTGGAMGFEARWLNAEKWEQAKPVAGIQ
ncbi:MAG: hypothetical protein V4671_16420 [Armatimonadota bacterium]